MGPMRRDTGAPTPWRRGPAEQVTVLAHRGGDGPWHENSLEAFTGALREGADGVELDVRRTLDGVLIVHHDPDVPGVGPVAQLRAGELPGHVPTLAAALEACGGAALDIEIKNLPTEPGYDPDQRVATEVGTLLAAGPAAAAGGGTWPSRVVVSSFWPDTLAALAGPAGPGAGGAGAGAGVPPPWPCSSTPPSTWTPPWRLPPGWGAWRSTPTTPR